MTTSTDDSLQQLNARLLAFASERNWEQFHSPKNLSMALIAECAELVEHFQWLSEDQSQQLSGDKQEEVALEMADILIYLIRIAQRLDIDLIEAAQRKIAINESRYPPDRSMAMPAGPVSTATIEATGYLAAPAQQPPDSPPSARLSLQATHQFGLAGHQ